MLSLPKIMLLLAVVAVVVVISRSLRSRAPKPGGDAEKPAENKALDLSPCPVCGSFVAADTRGCERAECPYAV